MPASHVALLRGINVGGKNPLPMKALAEEFVAAGCKDVRTFIQSGNVIFSAPPDHDEDLLARLLCERLAKRFNYNAPLVLRATEELRAAVANNPYLALGAPEDSLHVMFLTATPEAEAVKKLDPDRSPGDEYQVIVREIYLRLPNGMARTKLTNAYFDSKLGVTSTARNWRTTTKLLELMEE
ncbi:MAG TPA: DUF1697 domain-containing protein [Ktedonobacterales bacterium]|jgi:uncharacterized protein (DUF1697 family)|nr:DUF1697 domain-containing protein [Ktedonobacterales bacterium]